LREFLNKVSAFQTKRHVFKLRLREEVHTGGVIIINGTLKNLTPNQEFSLSPHISIDTANPFGSFDINGFPRSYYALEDSKESWYFRMESRPNPIILKPGEKIDYEIRLYPLKAGIYHVHSYFIRNDGHDGIARGETVQVTGSTMTTTGEVVGFYLPLSIGAASMIILSLKARKAANELGFGRIRKGIKMYFAVKASVEVIWLSGLLVWLIMVAYSVLQPFETRLISLVLITTILAAITVSSYITTISKAKLQNFLATITAAASAIFYFFLLFGVSFHFDLTAAAFGYFHNPLVVNPLFLVIAITTNAVVTALLLWKRKEDNITAKAANELTSRQ